MKTVLNCIACESGLSQTEKDFSLNAAEPVVVRAIAMYLALKMEEIPVALEYSDNRKRVVIVLPGKLYIEVSDIRHDQGLQAMIALRRRIRALNANIPTIQIPVYLLNHPEPFRQTVQELVAACKLLMEPTRVSEHVLSMN